jgi:DNA/RNA endonuclease YhcR with UshA esterase domain
VEEGEEAGSVVRGVSSLLRGKQEIALSEDTHFLPARPSVQEVGRRQGRGLGSEEGKVVGSGPLGKR